VGSYQDSRTSPSTLTLTRAAGRHSFTILQPSGFVKRFIDLVGVEANNYCAINDDHRGGHIAELLEIGQSAGVLRYVPLLEA